MWKCPKCDALNYEKGACECCGFGGVKSTQAQYQITWPETPSQSGTDAPCYVS